MNAVQAWLVFTSEEAAAAETLNDGDAAVIPVEINNPLANNHGFGVLVGRKVAPARLLNDPLYVRWLPSCGSLPIHVMDSDTLFLPIAMPD